MSGHRECYAIKKKLKELITTIGYGITDMQKRWKAMNLSLKTMEIIQINQINEMNSKKKYKNQFKKKLWNIGIHWCGLSVYGMAMHGLLLFSSSTLIYYGCCASNTFVFS